MARKGEKPFYHWDWTCRVCSAQGSCLAKHWQQAKTTAFADHPQDSGCEVDDIRVQYRKDSQVFPTEGQSLAVLTEGTSMPVEGGGLPGPFAQALTRFLNTEVGPAMGRGDVLHRCRYMIDRAIAASDVYDLAKDKAAMLKAGFPYLRLYAEILGLVGPRVSVTDGESLTMVHNDRQRMMLQDPVFRDLVERMEIHAAHQDARIFNSAKVVDVVVVDDGADRSDDPGRVRDAGVEGAMGAQAASRAAQSSDDGDGDG